MNGGSPTGTGKYGGDGPVIRLGEEAERIMTERFGKGTVIALAVYPLRAVREPEGRADPQSGNMPQMGIRCIPMRNAPRRPSCLRGAAVFCCEGQAVLSASPASG